MFLQSLCHLMFAFLVIAFLSTLILAIIRNRNTAISMSSIRTIRHRSHDAVGRTAPDYLAI
jgi:hypothetical protein